MIPLLLLVACHRAPAPAPIPPDLHGTPARQRAAAVELTQTCQSEDPDFHQTWSDHPAYVPVRSQLHDLARTATDESLRTAIYQAAIACRDLDLVTTLLDGHHPPTGQAMRAACYQDVMANETACIAFVYLFGRCCHAGACTPDLDGCADFCQWGCYDWQPDTPPARPPNP